MRMLTKLKDRKLSFSKLKSVSLKAKNNRIKSGIKFKKRSIKFLLDEATYCLPFIGSEVTTFIKYN